MQHERNLCSLLLMPHTHPTCSTATGNCGDGYEVSQRRNCLCVLSAESCSQMRSRVGIQEVAKWQF